MNILAVNWADALNVVIFSISMVFVLLILIVIVLSIFSKIVAPKVRVPKKTTENNSQLPQSIEKEYVEDHLSAGDSAAIAMALHLYYSEVHDEESAVITIKTVERRYSPWSSKIYGLNNLVK
ncbi:MAG: hypothetical protein EOM47_05040 [Bacteroidia bacterium]|jgi:Na+-transporting methylmalonyl-CoA/oxaloacetate decarboxylase gamma subunit|nr:OadG family transporter subunit [Paludibacter sp.]NCB68196.1 hypothetical protein [Bacteroidia bacterium]